MITAKIIITPISPRCNQAQYDIDVYINNHNEGAESIRSFDSGNGFYPAAQYAVNNSDRVYVQWSGKGFYAYDKEMTIAHVKTQIQIAREEKKNNE